MTQPPQAFRDGDRRWVAGVAAGLAEHLGWNVVWTRAAFVVLTFAGGLGAALYAGFWIALPLRRSDRPALAQRDLGLFPLLAMGGLMLGLVLLLLDVDSAYLAAFVLLGLGAAIVWRQVDDEGRGNVSAAERWGGVAAGVALVLAGIGLMLVDAAGTAAAMRGLLVGILVAGGLALLALPWVRRQQLERAEAIRAAERAEVAAQVHDSVLQTLTLIRTHAADAEAVARLARAEERRLRTWLYTPVAEATLRAALEAAAADVESRFAVTVEVVAVGDCPLTPRAAALVAAGSEALVNAAKHAGGAIALYCEVEPQQVSVFVRDRGAGFDLGGVPTDRLGVRESIIGRMERNGGRAEIRTGESGTEVRLVMPR